MAPKCVFLLNRGNGTLSTVARGALFREKDADPVGIFVNGDGRQKLMVGLNGHAADGFPFHRDHFDLNAYGG